MKISIIVPQEGESMLTATITKWYVSCGDTVYLGDPICEIESEKSTFVIDSPVDGTVTDILFGVNEEVPVLQPLAIIEQR
jgi:pyruvate/2-oxoglutarate dehydrogenase complex dihydrolipoamide acyltransferase (E2) component